jgi:O-antigen/teichoic acid export membrane protein
MILVVFSEQLIFIWTGNATLAKAIGPIVSLLAVGSALHGVMYIPHALQLAYGMIRIPLRINAILILLWVPVMFILVKSFGGIGGATAWLILHLVYMLLGTFLTHRVLLKGLATSWLIHDVGTPFVIALFAGFTAHILISGTGLSIFMQLFYAGFIAVGVVMCSVITSARMRQLVSNHLKKWALP